MTKAMNFSLMDETYPGGMPSTFFLRELATGKYPHFGEGSWQTLEENAKGGFPKFGMLHKGQVKLHNHPAFGTIGPHTRWIDSPGNYTAIVTVHPSGTIIGSVGARTQQIYEEFFDLLRSKYVEEEDTTEEEEKARVSFWSMGSMGPASRSRKVAVPSWEDIEENYAEETHGKLNHLMNDFVPGTGGQMLLWHGAPGTGKTYSLRALGWEWRKWADLHYITDPDAFFGSGSYMLDVLLDDEIEYERDAKKEKHPLAEDGRWKVLVLEDTGELMSADARERSGQGLARLLNTADGLIGQGLKVLILVSTNEALESLHEAVQRPGRCASEIQFLKLDKLQAQEWVDKHNDMDKSVIVTEEFSSVADLYSLIHDGETSSDRKNHEKKTIGFV
jgi:hypothetical protein